MNFRTADLCDEFADEVQVAEPLLQNYGGVETFAGQMTTIDVYEDNSLIREVLETEGRGRVLVVDGGGSLLRAIVDHELAQTAKENGWAGIVVHGCVRQVVQLSEVALGIRALNAVPRGGRHTGGGNRDRPVHFAGTTFRAKHYLYADADGIVVAPRNLLEEAADPERAVISDQQ